MDDVKVVDGKNDFIITGFRKEDHETEELAPIVLIGVLDSGAQCRNGELNVGASAFAKEEGLCNKSGKDFSILWGQLRRSASGVEVHRSGSGNGVIGSKLDGEIVEHGLNVVFHVDADLAMLAKIEVHC